MISGLFYSADLHQERYNLSDTTFDAAAFDGWVPSGYDGSLRANPPPFAAENILILTDGACSSTCALFVEMMSHEAGVRTVVVGGSPIPGPMQAVSGTRGALVYSADVLDSDFGFASSINATAAAVLPQVRDPGMAINYAGFNLRDQVRQDSTTPLQFQYEAADCRVYYTMKNVLNETQLWLDAAAALWENNYLCVVGSTGYTTRSNSTSGPKPPPIPSNPTSNGTSMQGIQSLDAIHLIDDNMYNGMQDGLRTTSAYDFRQCDGTCQCVNTATCPDGHTTVKLCATSCSDESTTCGGQMGVCAVSQQFEDKFNVQGLGVHLSGKKNQLRTCQPNLKQPFPGCPGVKNF